MIKIRVMGTREDLVEFKNEFKDCLGSYQLSNTSDLLPNKGSDYLRMYGELYKGTGVEEVEKG